MIIVGNNARGKSAWMRKCVEERYVKSGNTILTNLKDVADIQPLELPWNQEAVQLLEDVLVGCTVRIGAPYLGIEFEDGSSPTLHFIHLMSILCKDAHYVYLDEPDFGLTTMEKLWFTTFVCRIYGLYKEFFVISHDMSFVETMRFNLPLYTLKDGDLVPFDWEGLQYGKLSDTI